MNPQIGNSKVEHLGIADPLLDEKVIEDHAETAIERVLLDGGDKAMGGEKMGEEVEIKGLEEDGVDDGGRDAVGLKELADVKSGLAGVAESDEE